jgi:hypothetical protein
MVADTADLVEALNSNVADEEQDAQRSSSGLLGK